MKVEVERISLYILYNRYDACINQTVRRAGFSTYTLKTCRYWPVGQLRRGEGMERWSIRVEHKLTL
jgi:hypothetical protein